MKTLDMKSVIIGVLLIITVFFGLGATDIRLMLASGKHPPPTGRAG